MSFDLMIEKYLLFLSYIFIFFGTINCQYNSRQQYDKYGSSQYNQDNHQDRDRVRFSNDRNGYQDNRDNRYGGSGGGIYGGSGSNVDSCIEKAGYEVKECEDTLMHRQLEVRRSGTNSKDFQHGICCSLYFYRDCLSRAVTNRCHGDTPATVADTLMGTRKWDLTLMCRDYYRDQCSRSYAINSSSITVVSSILIAFKFIASNML